MATPGNGKDGDALRPVIIRRKKITEEAHHGGTWKVAYADFVTALMAFFLVMWLVAAANDAQRAAIFSYFKDPSAEQGIVETMAPGLDGPGGASTSPIDLDGGLDAPLTPEQVKEFERQQAEKMRKDLEAQIAKIEALKPYEDQLLIDVTAEGLRIQIVDAQNRPMFALSGTELKPYARDILVEVGKFLNTVPNRITITGHTDTAPFIAGRPNYDNWELSADRANAARRTLLQGGLERSKVARVIGMSSYVLLDADNPRNPMNRRISIVVLNKSTEEAITKESSAPAALSDDLRALPARP
jgi:chemotaxis protein MotB